MSQSTLRFFEHAELVLLLTRAGFEIEDTFGGFDRAPLTDSCPEIVIIARAV